MGVAFTEVEQLALNLDVRRRGQLASILLRSLPTPWDDDDDEGFEEAMRRSREIENNPDASISHEDFLRFFADRTKG